jgi:hypothetical protein
MAYLSKNTYYRVRRNFIENKDGNPQKSFYVIGSGDVSVYFSPEQAKPNSTAEMQLDAKTLTQVGSPYSIEHDFEWILWTSDDDPDVVIMGMVLQEDE